VEFPPATPTSSRAVPGGGDITGGAASTSGKKGALELALQSPTTSLASDSQKPQCSVEMQQILRLALRDGDEWVRLFATILAPFPNSQSIDVEPCTEGNMEGVQAEVAEALSLKSDCSFIPHEFACLNHSVLSAAHKYAPPTGHTHFTLRQQPQASVQLRNEILQKAEMDFAQTGSLVKDRHLLQRQMSATGSNPFVSTSRSSSSRKSVPIPGHTASRVQRERGTKLLDINEVPLNFKRKRRAAADLELPGGGGESKKTRTSSKSEPDTPTPTLTSATPDYAAGLGVEFPPATPTSSQAVPRGGDVTGGAASTSGKKGALELALQSPTTSLASDSQKPQSSTTPVTPFYSLTSPTYQPYPRATATPSGPIPPHISPFTPGTPSTPTLPTSPSTPQPKLKVTRQQLLIAQEMFKESPNLTREHKALILGFMAGARENPYPNREVVTIKLNDRVQEESEGKKVLIETVFEMNYKTGMWRKLQYKRPHQ
jgi:negative elongation factor A